MDTDNPLFQVYMYRWTIQCIQAWFNWQGEPQAIENVLILTGPQGTGKTRWLNSLVRDQDFARGVYLNFGTSASGDRDVVRQATSAPLAELGELETTFNRTAQGHLKNFLSRKEDSYRLPYGRSEVRYPRTTCFAGTVNTLDFLVDTTGSRRFWPVEVRSCNPEHGIDLQQLWAEVYAHWLSGEKWWLTEAEDTARRKDADQFHFDNPATEQVQQYLDTHTDRTVKGMTCSQIMDMLNIPGNNANKRSVTDFLTRMLGPRTRVDGLRNAWAVPTGQPALELLKGKCSDVAAE